MSNNLLYEGNWQPPFQLAREQSFSKGGRNFGPTRLIDGRLFVTRPRYLACVDPETRKVLWEIERKEPGVIGTHGDDQGLYADIGGGHARLDPDSGAIQWQSDPEEYLYAVGTEALIVVRPDGDRDCATYRDRGSGDTRWATPFRSGRVDELFLAEDLVVLKGAGVVEVLDAASGEPSWCLESLAWCEQHFAERANAWKEGPSAKTGRGPHLSLGPLVDGTLYLSLGIGLVVALDAGTGDLRWSSDMPGSEDVARTLVVRGGRLYFNSHQYMGRDSRLSAVDASDGTPVFRHDQPFTPEGCSNPILLDRHFLGGSGQHAAAYDVESQEFVWQYRYPKKARAFTVRPCAVPGGFVTTCGEQNKLLWFESEPD